ncbi:hypothetical protein VPH35_036851 [Triticum aestivum]
MRTSKTRGPTSLERRRSALICTGANVHKDWHHGLKNRPNHHGHTRGRGCMLPRLRWLPRRLARCNDRGGAGRRVCSSN